MFKPVCEIDHLNKSYIRLTEQHFPMVLFIMLHEEIPSFGSANEILMKATERYFPVRLFIMLYKVVLTFEPVDEILKCDHSNERY